MHLQGCWACITHTFQTLLCSYDIVIGTVVTGAGQKVQEFSATCLAPTLGGFATQTWQLMSTKISILDQQLKEGIQKNFNRRQLLELQNLPPDDKSVYTHEYNPRSTPRSLSPANQNQGPKDASQNIPGTQS